MNEEEFKKTCPNLFNSMQSNMHTYEVYGIKFQSHTPLAKKEIIDKFENFNVFQFYNAKITGEKPNICTPDIPFIMVLN